MVSVLASRSSRVKPKTMKLVFVASPLSIRKGVRAKTGRHGIRIMCPSGATCLSADCCFSELALLKSNSVCWSRTKRTPSSSHWKLTCSGHDIAEKLLSYNHSLTRFSLRLLITSLVCLNFIKLRESYCWHKRGFPPYDILLLYNTLLCFL